MSTVPEVAFEVRIRDPYGELLDERTVRSQVELALHVGLPDRQVSVEFRMAYQTCTGRWLMPEGYRPEGRQ